MSKKSVIIVGAGIGGLCTAARLSSLGYQVSVFEKEALVGGRANRIEKDGYKFDIGPTLLMMTDVLEETFRFCGKKMNDYLELIQLEPNYQVVFGDHSRVEVSSNLPRLTKQLALLDEKAPERFFDYFASVSEFYRLSRHNYIERNFDKLSEFVNIRHGSKLLYKHGLQNLWDYTGRYFDDERLRQLFSFQSMYLGVSPYEAPAIYSTVSYMETALGIWYPKGGMYSLSLALAKLCRDLGVKITTNSPVEQIIVESGRAKAVRVGGKQHAADIIVANSDLVYSHQYLLNETSQFDKYTPKLQKLRQASSAMLFYWGVNDDLDGLLHHNVILSNQFKQNLQDIFHNQRLPKTPSFYVYVPTKTDPRLAPPNRHIMYVLVPVPNLSANIDWPKAAACLKKQVLARCLQEFKIDLTDKIDSEEVFGPEDFKTKFNLPDGSAFGLSHTLAQSAYFRPHNKSTDIKNLFFVGASTYPGGGVPMVTISAKLVVERIQKGEANAI